MLNLLWTILSVLTTALKRLRANLGLALCALIALLAAVALSVSIPIYADGASLRLLQEKLAHQEQQTQRSTFALLFRYYVGGAKQALEWERVKAADDFISDRGLARLNLPIHGLARHARTGELRLFLPPSAGGQNQFLKNVSLGFLSGMDAQIRIVDGATPHAAASIQQPVEVMIMRELASEVGINVGDQFTLVTAMPGVAI